jgi:hypothetical protein
MAYVNSCRDAWENALASDGARCAALLDGAKQRAAAARFAAGHTTCVRGVQVQEDSWQEAAAQQTRRRRARQRHAPSTPPAPAPRHPAACKASRRRRARAAAADACADASGSSEHVELDVPLFDELCGLASSVFEVLLLLLIAAAVFSAAACFILGVGNYRAVNLTLST